MEYAQKRAAAKRLKLRWRVSYGARRSLGWLPFKAASLKRKGNALRFCGKTFRVFERERLDGVKWKQGCFAQDAVGDWWLCLPVEQTSETTAAPKEAVGIDLASRMQPSPAMVSVWKRCVSTATPRKSWVHCRDADICARPSACTGRFVAAGWRRVTASAGGW
jgi:hypothetical protein